MLEEVGGRRRRRGGGGGGGGGEGSGGHFERGVCVHSSGLFHGGDEGRREGEGGVTVAMLDRSE